ncbi:MAG TPA: class I SAM-dependent methyltransferase [Tepidisphaeraceae bacterium]|nr:class I SAM-dependent methyltransferase [Tepidisphaeraceae bacterium]
MHFGPVMGRSFRMATRMPLQIDAFAQTIRMLLDNAYDMLVDAPQDTGSAMYHLQFGLHEVKSRCSADEWERVIAECQSHRISRLVLQDPFTRHSYEQPGGYAGDARLLDYLYGVAGIPAGTTPLGASVFGHWMTQRGALGVRARGDVLAEMIDETATTFERPRILSIACGHLREGTRSAALMDGRVGELVALDQDPKSLAEVERVYAGTPVRTMHCSVRAILSGKVKLEGFQFVYAAGLYDYLSERVAQRLTRLMFDMLAPGGRLLVANFAPGMPEVGYMEAFMAWTLTYRTPEEMARLSVDIPGDEWRSHRVFWDASENIVFLDVEKRPADNAKRFAAAVPGLKHVSFGRAVGKRQPTSPTGDATPPLDAE